VSTRNRSIHSFGHPDDNQREGSLPEHARAGDGSSVVAEDTSVACNATPLTNVDPKTEGDDRHGSTDLTDITERELDGLISARAAEIQVHHREADSHTQAEYLCWRDLMPLLDEKQKRLTSRGKKSDKNFTTFLLRNNLNPNTVRSWRRRLKKEMEPGQETLENDEASTAALSSEATGRGEDQREEIKTGPELLAEHVANMLDLFTDKTVQSDATRISRTVSLLKDLQRAIDEGKLFAVEPSPAAEPEPQPPAIKGDPVVQGRQVAASP
jgi:hypothetical protein